MKTSDSFLPDFCNLYSFFMLTVSSELLAFVLTLADLSSTRSFWSDLGVRSGFILGIALGSGAVLCGLRRRLERLNAISGGIAAFAVIQATTLLVAWLSQRKFAATGPVFPAGGTAGDFYGRILLISGLVGAAWLRYWYVRARWRVQIKAEGEARLEALQARVRPHFLFNSLNTIASLARTSPATAEELLLDLSELFRAILRNDAKLVTLAEELVLVRQYLNIERQRLGERLEIAWNLDHAPEDALIPPLSLQPLVENAIYHGIEPAPQGGLVEIRGRLSRKRLHLTIRNTLPESDARQSRSGSRLAIANLRARLDACFPNQTRLLTSLADEFYQVRIVLPYLTHDHEYSHR
jgi:two-component system sensor histidine kinase AlgZ